MAASSRRLVERGVTTVFLEVAADNPGAQGLYASLGFVQVGRRKGYYARSGGAVDALVLSVALPLPVA